MKRAVIIFLALAVLLVGAALIAPGFVDWNKHKPQILAQLHEATGHDYAIEGDIALSLLPFPHVSVGGLSVAAPASAGGKKLLEIEKASVQLALMPLFGGQISVSKVLLQKPSLTLSRRADGTLSLMTPELQQKMTGAQSGNAGGGLPVDLANAIKLNEISIKGGSFSFEDAAAKNPLVLSDIDAALRGESLFGPYNLSGSLVRSKHEIGFKVDTGRVDKPAEAVSVRAEFLFPGIASSASYSGVVSLKDGTFEAQGETGIETPDAGAFAALLLAGQAAPPAAIANKPLALKGILTAARNEIAYRNLKASFAGAEGTGAVVLKNFGKAAGAPLDAEISFETAKSFALEKILPPRTKTGAAKEAAGLSFLPETVTLPRAMTGRVTVKAPAFSYGGAAWRNAVFSIDAKEQGFTVKLALKGENGTDIDMGSLLSFGSRTVSPKTGAVTYADPVLTMDIAAQSAEPLGLVALLPGKKPLNQAASNILAGALDTQAHAVVKHRSIEVKDTTVKLGDTVFAVAGGFVPGAGEKRDAASLSVGTTKFDADFWLEKAAGSSNAAVAAPAAKPDIAALARRIVLPFDLDLTLQAGDVRFKGKDYAELALKAKLAAQHLDLETLRLSSSAGDAFLLAGSVADLKTLGGLDLSFKADVADLERTLETLNVKAAKLPADVGKASFLGEARGNPESLSFTANLKALRGTMEASGQIADALGAPKFSDLTLRLKHPNYADLARLYNPDFTSGVAIRKDLDIFASMNRKGNIYTFSQLAATVGPSQIKGDIVADMGGAKPMITAALEFTDFPLDDFLGVRKGGGSSRGQGSAAQGQDVRWSRNAIKTAIFHKANVALKATARSLSYGNWNLKNAAIAADLKDGVLDIAQMDGLLYGGHAALTGTLKTSPNEREPLSFAGKILAQDVELEDFVSSFSGSRLVSAKGAVSVETSLQTTGISPAALVFDLKGKGTAQGKDIVFEGFDLARLSQALAQPTTSLTENFGKLLDASMRGGTTRFDSLDGVFTITEGVINFDKMDLTGASADVITRGTVSLPLWSMDLESTVQLKDPADAPPLRASFKGPLDNPAQTFGQSAMQQYFQRQLEGVVVNPLLDKIDKSGALKSILGTGGAQRPPVTPQPSVPQPSVPSPSVPQEGVSVPEPVPAEPAPTPAPAPAPAPEPEAQKEMTPEDAIFGIIQNVIEAQ